jgi:tRNA nucleotidyltransferase/poly(A) polymerase
MKILNFTNFLKENKSERMDIPEDILEIAKAYINSGKEIYLVGGCVRDFILGKKPKDFDLVTNSLPEESKKILKDFNVSDEQGKNFGVIRVYTPECREGHEIASFRKDISKGRDTKGAGEKVKMGKDITIEDDCQRRDLTMNALYYDIKENRIIDLVGGVEDIKKGIIRSVGDPSKRFEEDRLRIMRIFRFAARTESKIDSQTAESIRKDNRLRGIGSGEDVSQERIWEEICKAFEQSKDFNFYLHLLTDFDMWDQIFPGSSINTDFIDSEDFICIISNLFKNEKLEGLSKKMVELYKIDSSTTNKIVFLISLRDFSPENVFDYFKSKERIRIDDDTIREWVEVSDFNKRDLLIKFLDYSPSVSAEEVMSMGYKGREIGNKIKEMEYKKFIELIKGYEII